MASSKTLDGSSTIIELEERKLDPTCNDENRQHHQLQFPQKTTLNIDGVVNPEMLHAHLTLLTKFKELEQSDQEMDDRYLLRAEQRYIAWINLLNDKNFPKEEMPIPPLDVCLIWHAHCLSPLRYYEDMLRLHDPQAHNYSFPLARLARHLDEYSQQIWHEYTKKPWVLELNDDSPFDFKCPLCNKIGQISPDIYVKAMRTNNCDIKCNICSRQYMSEFLSVSRFVKDILTYRNDPKKLIGGTIVDLRNGTVSKPNAEKDCNLLFSSPGITISTSTVYTWKEINTKVKNHTDNLKTSLKLKDVRNGIIKRIIFAYMDIPAPFSIDLVSAVKRQRDFTNKMVDNSWINCMTVQSNAVERYHKFINLQKDYARTLFVPTLDIDLAWHTHMLHPSLYRNFTNKHMGRMINHDDTLAKKT
ncbi:11775_t:CDS:2, partial [Ambispora leptoticha]